MSKRTAARKGTRCPGVPITVVRVNMERGARAPPPADPIGGDLCPFEANSTPLVSAWHHKFVAHP